MIVVDANAWVVALVEPGERGAAVRGVLEADPEWAAPAHAPIEVLRTLRKFERAELLDRSQADDHARAVVDSEVRFVVPSTSTFQAVWRWRHNLSTYDAPYLHLAAELDVPLVTLDTRLAAAARSLDVDVVVPEA